MNDVPHNGLNKMRRGLVTAAFLFVLVLFPVMSHAGGLGFAPLAAIAGIAGYVSYWGEKNPARLPMVFWALGVFIIWAFITSFWSPYDDPQTVNNPMKLVLGIGLYSGVFLLGQKYRHILAKWLPIIGIIILALLLIDLLTGYGLTKIIDPVGEGEHPIHHANTINMNLGHSMAILALLSPLVTVLLLRKPNGKMWALIWTIAIAVTAVLSGLTAGVLAVIFAIGFMFLASKRPSASIRLAIGLGMISILFAPFAGYLMKFVGPEAKAAISGSWEHRVEMWAYVSDMIARNPILGHGFDASRTFDETFEFRNFGERTKVSLHPHNNGMHIWAETGAIGAALAATTLFFLGSKILSVKDATAEFSMATAGFLGAVLAISLFTFGVWQEWWWGALFLIGSFIPSLFVNKN